MNIQWPHLYALAFIAGTVCVLVATPIFQHLAVRLDIMDRPRHERHKFHKQATPLLGGAAMFLSWLAVLLTGALVLLPGEVGWRISAVAQNFPGLYAVLPRLGFIVAGGAGAVLLGLVDDCRGMRAQWKFLGQFLVALLAVGPGGIRISLFCDTPGVGIAISVFWFMLLMNAINFFDNMDGLAAGTATIALALFTGVAAFQAQYFVASLSALSCGVTLGFWFYNYPPASIFMGDSGSHFLGFMLAVVSASTTYFSPELSSTRLPVLIPLFILAIPLFDTLAVTVIRTVNRKPFWIGDHNHISHRFVKMGLSRKRAVQLVHLLCLLTGLAALPILWGDAATAAVICIQGVLLLLLVTILQYGVRPPDINAVVPPDGPAAK